MTRREYEDRLLDAFEAFERVWKELNPEGSHIDAFIVDGTMCIMEFDRPAVNIFSRCADGTRGYSDEAVSE